MKPHDLNDAASRLALGQAQSERQKQAVALTHEIALELIQRRLAGKKAQVRRLINGKPAPPSPDAN